MAQAPETREENSASEGPAGAKRRRRILIPVKALAGLLVALLLFEGLLQILGLIVSVDEQGSVPAEGAIPILCIGDSHTYGLDVAAPFKYPNRLHALLNAGRMRDRYTVINRGVPGWNSAKVRERLPRYVEQIQPALVLILCGYNNSWNPYGSASWDGEGVSLESMLSHLKTFKLAKLILLRLKPPPEPEEPRITTEGDRLVVVEEGEASFINPGDGSAPGLRTGAELERVTRKDLEACVRICRESGARPVLLTYAFSEGHFDAVNRAARDVSREGEVPLIDQAAVFRADMESDERHRIAFGHLHLNPLGYERAAQAICDALVSSGLVEAPPGGAYGGSDRAALAPGELNLFLRVGEGETVDPGSVVVIGGARGVTYQLLLSLARFEEGGEGLKIYERQTGLAMDELARLSITIPSFTGTFGDQPVRVALPMVVLTRYAGKEVFCTLLALDPHATNPEEAVLAATAPSALTLPER